jgi:lysozyme
MKTSQSGIDLIKEFESWSADLYRCPANLPTIGWGHVVRPGETYKVPITREQGEAILAKDLERFEREVERAVRVDLDQHQFDALVAFAFNVGAAAFRNSTLLRMLNEGQTDQAADQFPRWNKSGGKVLAGLTRRRNAERELFLGTAEG